MKKLWILLLISLVGIAGCSTEPMKKSDMQIYYFDTINHTLNKATLLNDTLDQYTELQQVEYIIAQLNSGLASGQPNNQTQSLTQLPIKNYEVQERVVKINLTEAYYRLPIDQKIGIRVAIVYSLTELPFIDGVEFSVEQVPLVTATGKIVGVIYRNDIKEEALEPNPATKTYVLNVYFANKEGKLVKEVHSITGSHSSKEEKLILEELIQGPKSNELVATLPNNVKINTIDTLNGVCQVDLSFDSKTRFFKNDQMRYLTIYSIVNSLTELPKIKKVIISIDGKENIKFGPIELPKTFERSEAYVSKEADYPSSG